MTYTERQAALARAEGALDTLMGVAHNRLREHPAEGRDLAGIMLIEGQKALNAIRQLGGASC
jgi:hypothetical protein